MKTYLTPTDGSLFFRYVRFEPHPADFKLTFQACAASFLNRQQTFFSCCKMKPTFWSRSLVPALLWHEGQGWQQPHQNSQTAAEQRAAAAWAPRSLTVMFLRSLRLKSQSVKVDQTFLINTPTFPLPLPETCWSSDKQRARRTATGRGGGRRCVLRRVRRRNSDPCRNPFFFTYPSLSSLMATVVFNIHWLQT